MILIYFLLSITILFAGWRIWRRVRYFLHIFQLEGYKRPEYRHWLGDRLGQVVLRLSHRLAFVVLIIAYGTFNFVSDYWTAVFVLPIWSILFISSRLYRSHQAKKPLKYTARLKRLLVTTFILLLLPVIIGIIFWANAGTVGLLWILVGLFVADLGAPLWVLIASLLMNPVESFFQIGFIRKARRIIESRPDLTVIGITGSYGKTSVKFILAEILRQRFSVLVTPSSYNTPMGLCIVINNMLKPEHQVLVLEMGARYRGDIKELCGIAQPDISIVTSVGVAHLETMGPIENIAQEKGDILIYMQPQGTAVLNADNDYVALMESRAVGKKIWTVSTNGKDADLLASAVKYSHEGSTFNVTEKTGDRVTIRTNLLGKHNVLNILLSLAVGRELGLRLRQMAYAVQRVKPIEHRLQLRHEGNITIIDDAFNSNPVGARNAVEILGQFTTGRRIIVTPGMIELGEKQDEENRQLGAFMSGHVDLAILVGKKQTQPILDGLRSVDFPPDNIKVHGSLFEAQAYLKSILQAGDVVLYENDLPDQYTEA